jgi:predicted DNA binding CopG/RHH family protein
VWGCCPIQHFAKEIFVLKAAKKKPKLKLMNFKVSEADIAAIKRKAKRHTGGNISTWIRYASTQLTPKKKDVSSK